MHRLITSYKLLITNYQPILSLRPDFIGLKKVIAYIKKDWSLDWKNKFSIGGILLYLVAATFIVFLSFADIEAETWNSLFWIILLFGILNGVVKSFLQESGSRKLYYFQLVNPYVVLIAKVVYNFLLTFIMAWITFFLLVLFTGNMVEDLVMFTVILTLGSLSLSITLTFISALSVQGQQSATLTAILGLPVVIPVVLTLVKLSRNALGLTLEANYRPDLLILAAISLILLGLSLWLFPLIWRE